MLFLPRHALCENPEFDKKQSYRSYAFWITGGAGLGKSRRGDNTENNLNLDLAANLRCKNKLMACMGEQQATYHEGNWVRSRYFVLGKSSYNRISDWSFLLGLSHNQYDYESGQNYKRRRTDPALGINLIFNGTLHLAHVLGLGLKFSINANKECSYILLSLNPCLGTWNIR
jgi:hypothetical protein